MEYIHVHTCYSLLDSVIKPEELVPKVKELGGTALCVTEHGNLYSSIKLYELCQKHGVKYLHGVEAYICDDVNVRDKNAKYYHLVLISKNETGRLNLLKLVSESSKYKYNGKPRIDFEMLKQHKEGLIVSSACMAGEVSKSLMKGEIVSAYEIATKYKGEFGDDYYLEIQSHNAHEQQQLNRQIVSMADQLGIKYIVTTDAHFLEEEDQKYHSIFVQIGQTREVGETYNDCFIQTEEQVRERLPSLTEREIDTAISNLNEIVSKCDVQIPLSAPIMPHVPIPDEYGSEYDYLVKLCEDGKKARGIDKLPEDKRRVAENRIAYELDTIKEMGFAGYFLLVRSYCNQVERRGIGRGSAGGCFVAYLLGIVNTDSIEYDLYFERFLDVGSLQLYKEGKLDKGELKIPDVDADFGVDARDSIIKFISDTYGEDHFVSLGTFQFLKAKGAIKDVGRVLGIPFEITNEMTSKFDSETIQEVLDLDLLTKYKKEYPELFVYIGKIAGLPKSFGVHPCGRVLCVQQTNYYNATEVANDGTCVLQGDMHDAEDLGLVKIDLLGLRTIDVIYDVLDMIGKTYDYVSPQYNKFDDVEVYKSFRNGNTGGIFQFESSGMKHTLKSIRCSSLADLTVANALFRPGSMAFIQNYADRKVGKERVSYLHRDLEPILKDTYGIIVFQEQLIQIGRLAGLRNPDALRKATAKKKAELLEELKPELFDGLKKRGWTDKQMETLWDMMLDFAKYSFNKSHALAYAMTAYICMFLKVHHPAEFVTAWINSYRGDLDKIPVCVAEAKRMGVKVRIPQWKDCSGRAQLKDGIVYIGTQCIKQCNPGIAAQLLEINRQFHPKTFVDVLKCITEYSTIKKDQLEAMVQLNFFKEFGGNCQLMQILSEFKNGKSRYTKTLKDATKAKRLDALRIFEKQTEFLQLSIGSQLAFENDLLGSPVSTYDIPECVMLVRNVDTKYMPKRATVDCYNVTTGVTGTFKVKGAILAKDELKPGDLILLKRASWGREPAWRKDESGKWKRDYENMELWLYNWHYVTLTENRDGVKVNCLT